MLNNKRKIARQRLDERLSAFRSDKGLAVPPKGWIRAIRDALGISAPQLGRRLGIKAQSLEDMEKSEAHSAITLKSLRKVAEALDCTLVYALVPNTSLEDAVKTRARRIAEKELAHIGHTMNLEAQGLSEVENEAQIEDYIHQYIKERDLWEQP